jgi:hypothetical protein
MLSITKLKLKAQFTIVSLVMVLVMLVVYAYMYPTIETYIDLLIADSDPATATLISLIPFFIAIAIIMSIIWYIVPQKGGGR